MPQLAGVVPVAQATPDVRPTHSSIMGLHYDYVPRSAFASYLRIPTSVLTFKPYCENPCDNEHALEAADATPSVLSPSSVLQPMKTKHHAEYSGGVAAAQGLEDTKSQDLSCAPLSDIKFRTQEAVDNDIRSWTSLETSVFGEQDPADDQFTDLGSDTEARQEDFGPDRKIRRPTSKTVVMVVTTRPLTLVPGKRWTSTSRSPSPGEVERVPDYEKGETRSGRSFL
ncbi:hypothetical protein B0H13DRAFT_1859034 [Mycena leptocephala]|nr:hypothetical protein B0H13DRAFT_1859034 [Mycena leptocephala]